MQTPVAVAAVGVEVVTIINSWCRSSSNSTGAAVALVARVVVKLRKNARKDFSWQVQSVSLFVSGAVFGDAGLHFWEIGGHTKCWVFIQNACGISKPLRTDVLRSVRFVVVQRPSPSQIIYILAEEMMFLNFAFCCCCVVSRVCAMKSLLFCILSFYMSGNVCCGRGSYFFLSQGNRGADSFFVPPNLLEHRKSKNLQDQLSRLSRLQGNHGIWWF